MDKLEILDQRELLGKEFRVYGDKENPLFLAKDIASWIDHNQPSRIAALVDDEEKVMHNVHTLGGNQEMWFLTEDGLYEVLMQSRKPIAKAFKKEVKIILKQIRKTGGYIQVQEEDDAEILMAKALMVAQKTLARKDELLKAKDKIIKAKEIELGAKNKFIHQISVSENSLLVREVAKVASKNGITIGEKRLWQKLRDWGMIFKNTTEPKQQVVDKGYFEVVQGSRESSRGVFTYQTTRVTGKGQVYIIEKLLKENIEIA